MKRPILLAAFVLLLSVACLGQAQSSSCTITSSGGTCSNIVNLYGGMNATFEEVPSGSPATVSVTVQGCMRGGNCDAAADTNTSTSATIRGVSFTKPYNYFLITASWTGGTSPSMTVNYVITTARAPSASAAVSSVFGRTGAVVATNGDYTCAQVTNCNGATFQVDGTNLTSQSTVNFQDSNAFNGLTFAFSNPSAGNVKAGFSGTLGPGGIGTLVAGSNGLVASATTDTTNAGNISSGTLLAARMPALTGDVTSSVNTVATTVVQVEGAAIPTSAFLIGTNASKQLIAAQPFVVNAQTTTYQAVASDFAGCKTISVASGTFTLTLVASGSQPPSGQCINVVNYGSGVVTIARSGQNINGAAANFTLNAGSASVPTSTTITSDGTNYTASIDEGTVGTVTSVATTSPITGGTFTGSGTIACATCATTTNGGALSATAPVTISAAGVIACANCMVVNGVNTGTAAVTMDLSASTVSNALKVPVGAGLTSGTDGAVAYDSTNKNTHVRTNAADSIVAAFASAPTNNVLPKSIVASGNTLLGNSLLTDDGTTGTYTGTGGWSLTGTGSKYSVTSGTVTVSTPYISATQTWNAAGVAFTGELHNVTCTANAAASKAFDYQVAAASQLSLQFGATGCASPVLVLPNGTQANPSLAFAAGITSVGLYSVSANVIGVTNASNTRFGFDVSNQEIRLSNSSSLTWSSAATVSSTHNDDTCLSRFGAGAVLVSANAACTDGLGILVAGNTVRQAGSNFTTTATTATTWVSFPAFVTTARNYSFHCGITWQSSVNTAGMILAINNSITPTNEQATAIIYTNTTGAASTFTTGSVTSTASGSQTILSGGNAAAAATSYRAEIDGSIEVTSSGGILSFGAWNTSAATLTILRGSYCSILP